jgi:multidrug efflux pump subunit AcrB
MKLLRRVHLFLGCFFAPMLLFYVATGWYQTLTVRRNKALGEAEDWLGRLRSVHVDQLYPSETANAYSPLLFRMLVVSMALALIVTIVVGVVLAFRSIRQRWLVVLCLALGVILPALCLWLGQQR